MDIYHSISPLEYRYLNFDEANFIRNYLSEQAFCLYLAKVEAALVKAYSEEGLCSEKIAQSIAKAAENITAKEVYLQEKTTRHQLRSLVNCLAQKVEPQAARWIHLGATSHDIVCTADSLRYKEFCLKILFPTLCQLLESLIEIALREKNTAQVGRTHGQHAVPITFGFTIAEYISRLGSRIKHLKACAENLRGQFSGATGAYNAQTLIVKEPIAFETRFLQILGMKPGDHSTQIVEPEYLLDFLHAITSAFGVLANLADDMRHLQRSELNEVAEQFSGSQVGSSTMPHKRNPINFEHVKSLWKTFAPRMMTGYLDQISEHQRDLTNSASSRFTGELLCGFYLAVRRLNGTMKKLVVDKESLSKNLQENWEKTRAEPCYTILALNGCSDAHETIRKSVQNGENLESIMAEALERELSEQEKIFLAKPENYLGQAVKKTELVCQYWKKQLVEWRK